MAQRIRTGELSSSDATAVLRRFRSDIRLRRFKVVALTVRHYEMAEALLDTHGPANGLRTLDSLHLAVALSLQREGPVASVVAADKILCKVAAIEGLPAIDPEVAPPEAAP